MRCQMSHWAFPVYLKGAFNWRGRMKVLGAILSSLASAVFVPLSAVFCRFLQRESPRKREQDDHHESTDDR